MLAIVKTMNISKKSRKPPEAACFFRFRFALWAIVLAVAASLLWCALPAAAMDCETAAGIGYDYHTQRASAAPDPEVLRKAREYYEKALEMCPDYCEQKPELCNNLGDVCLRLGDPDRAAVYFKKALATRPDYGDAWFELGNVYRGKGLSGLALDAYLKAFESNPDDREAKVAAEETTRRLCENDNYRKTAEPGQVLSPEEMADGLVANQAMEKSNELFNICHKDIFVSGACLRNILFETGSARLKEESLPQLRSIRRMMEDNPEYRLVIAGHTDARPVTGRIEVLRGVFCEDNRCLSEQRAESVKTSLSQMGVQEGRLSSEGYGATRPADPARMEKNRRVELRLGGWK